MVVMTAVAMFQNASVSSNDHIATRKIFRDIGLKTAHQVQFKSRSEAVHKGKTNSGIRSLQQKISRYCKPALLVAFTVLFFIFMYCRCRKSPAGHKPLLESSTP